MRPATRASDKYAWRQRGYHDGEAGRMSVAPTDPGMPRTEYLKGYRAGKRARADRRAAA